MIILNKDIEPEVGMAVNHRHTGTKAIVTRIIQDEDRGVLINVSTYISPVIPELFVLSEVD